MSDEPSLDWPKQLSPWREIGHDRVHQYSSHPSGWAISVIEREGHYACLDGSRQVVTVVETVEEGKRYLETLLANEGFTIGVQPGEPQT